jgi:hypothetical protein
LARGRPTRTISTGSGRSSGRASARVTASVKTSTRREAPPRRRRSAARERARERSAAAVVDAEGVEGAARGVAVGAGGEVEAWGAARAYERHLGVAGQRVEGGARGVACGVEACARGVARAHAGGGVDHEGHPGRGVHACAHDGPREGEGEQHEGREVQRVRPVEAQPSQPRDAGHLGLHRAPEAQRRHHPRLLRTAAEVQRRERQREGEEPEGPGA